MGGDAGTARACAVDMVRRWEVHDHFDLYDDALPVLAELRGRGLKLGLISNGQRDLAEFARHHDLDVDVAVGSHEPRARRSRTRRSSRPPSPRSGSARRGRHGR